MLLLLLLLPLILLLLVPVIAISHAFARDVFVIINAIIVVTTVLNRIFRFSLSPCDGDSYTHYICIVIYTYAYPRCLGTIHAPNHRSW